MDRYIRVEGEEHLYRDTVSNSLVNTDYNEYQKFKNEAKKKNEINNLKNEIQELKEILMELKKKD